MEYMGNEQEMMTGKESVVDKVVNGIISDIIEGKKIPGDKLPTEKELCKQFGAGRNSVREAIKKLEASGIVYIKRADGTFIYETYNQKLLDPMLYSIILHKNSWTDFIELRSVIDIGTLQVLIQDVLPDENYNKLKKILLQMEVEVYEELPSVDKIMEYDTQFHAAIAAKTRNPQLITITEYVTRITVPSRKKAVKEIIEKGSLNEFIELHKQMLEVIEKRQSEKVVQTVRDHYVYWSKSR